MAAKDRRLYARFDIGMDEHPKIMLLSDAAFRALFESTMYARRQLTDGFLDSRIVSRKWGDAVAEELTSNSPDPSGDRSSWVKVDGGYQIHDFAEHQTTTADIQAKRDAGRAGGLAKAKRESGKPVAPASEVPKQNASKPVAKTETETETKTFISEVAGATPLTPIAGQTGTTLPKNFHLTAQMIAWSLANCPNIESKSTTEKFIRHYKSVAGRQQFKTDWMAAWELWMLKAQSFAKPEATPSAPTSPWDQHGVHGYEEGETT